MRGDDGSHVQRFAACSIPKVYQMNSKVAHPLKVANRRLGCVIPAAPAHGWPISHLHRFALTALIYAAAMLLLTSANAESRRAAAGGTEEPTSSTPSDRDEEAKRSFLEKYAKASERLEAGLSRLHARGHVRRFNARKKPTEEGATLEFFAKDGKRRVNIDYGSSQERPADTNAAPSETMLLTPETAALVTDPGTEFAFARHLSVKPDLGFERQFAGKAWCFVEASHLALDCLANGGCVLESVERDPEHAGLYHTRVLIGPKGQQTMDVWLEEARGFAIRKWSAKLSSGAEQLVEIGPYVSVGDGGWVPKKYVHTVYAAPDETPRTSEGEFRRVANRIEFELLGDVEISDIPDSYFKLDSLGVTHPSRPWVVCLLLSLAVALIVAVALSHRKWRIHQTAPGDLSFKAQQPRGST